MAIDFPNSPSLNYVFTDPTSNKSWKWDGEKWVNATTLTTADLPDSIITSDKLASSSVTSPKLSTATSGTTGDYLTRNTGVTSGFEWTTRVSTHSVLNSSFSPVTVSNTTSETTLISHSVSGISASNIIRIRAWGTFLNNTGTTTYTYIFKFKIGATTVLTSDALTNGVSSANNRRWLLDLSVYNPTLSSQHVTSSLVSSYPTTNTWASYTTAASGATILSSAGNNTSTEDMSTAKTFALTVQQSVASTSFNWIQTGYVIEKFS